MNDLCNLNGIREKKQNMVMRFDELKKHPPLTEDDIRIIENARQSSVWAAPQRITGPVL